MKNNIKVILAYGSAKKKIADSDKMYTKIFDKQKVNLICFECYLERAVGYSGTIDVFSIIYSGNQALPENRIKVQVSPKTNMISVKMPIVNKAGEHLVDGEYKAIFKIGNSQEYCFDFTVTGGTPGRFRVSQIIAKLAGL